VNAVFGLVTPLGALLFAVGLSRIFEANHAFFGLLLAFCGGNFLCIATSDLLPELHFHSHDRIRLSIALLAGIGVAVLVGFCEGEEHGHEQPSGGIPTPVIEPGHDHPSH